MNFYTPHFAIFVFLPTLLLANLIITLSLTILLPFRGLRNYVAHTIAKIWGRYCIYMLNIRIKKLDAYKRKKKKAYIIAVNHSTRIDPFICLSALSGQYRIVSEANMFRVVYIGAVMKASGYIPVRRKDNSYEDVINQISSYLRKGMSIVMFPEGKRIDGEEIGRIRKGILRISEINPNVEVLPVVIGGCRRVRKMKVFERIPKSNIYVKILNPFLFKDIEGEDEDKLNYLKTLFQNAYDELEDKYDVEYEETERLNRKIS